MYGKYRHSVDPKGRLFVPAKLREELGEAFDDEAAAPVKIVIPLALQNVPKAGQAFAGGVAEGKGIVVRHIGGQTIERQHGQKHKGGHGRRQFCGQRGGFPFRFQSGLLLFQIGCNFKQIQSPEGIKSLYHGAIPNSSMNYNI